MPKIEYIPKKFGKGSLEIIDGANAIIETYLAQGYKLTLRQLFYQFVSRDLIANKVSEYKRLGQIISDARLAGLIDWNSIEDRTRNLKALGHWTSPQEIMDSAAASYRLDKWETQNYRIEIWIEKEALAGVFERVANEFDVPFFCCRGYTSQSEMWSAAQRLRSHYNSGYKPLILHFGDHDPSGIDMTRDIMDRIKLFRCDMHLDRLALNMDQIEQYNPPPNPAKETDSRFEAYIERFGTESWELDALEPSVLADLVREKVESVIDWDAWNAVLKQEEKEKLLMAKASLKWDEVVDFLEQ